MVKVTTRKHKDLTGLVLIGGKSQRMGNDKSQISYHGTPQYQHLFTLLSKYCNDVYLSCNSAQKEHLSSLYPVIVDVEDGMGPLNGIRSALSTIKNAILIVSCDLPNINDESILTLISSRDTSHNAICFMDGEENINPLFSIWEKSCLKKLQSYEGDSPNKFLKHVKTKILEADSATMKNINTQKELRDFMKNQG